MRTYAHKEGGRERGGKDRKVVHKIRKYKMDDPK